MNAITSITSAPQVFPGNMRRELSHNVLRDLFWAAIAWLNVNIRGQGVANLNPTDSVNAQVMSSAFSQATGAQWLFSSAPLFILALGETICRKVRGEHLTPELIRNIWAPPLAASAAIPMWNVGQTIGMQIGTTSFPGASLWHGTSVAGGLIAAPFAGIFEGFSQWFVKYMFDVATNPETRKLWHSEPALMAKLFVKELLLNTTIGAIPGAVWQLVYFASAPVIIAALGPYGFLLVALLVAVSVMTANFFCTHAINQASSRIDEALGWDVQLEAALRKVRESIAEHRLETSLLPADIEAESGAA